MPMQPNERVWAPADLLERLVGGDSFFVVDVRNRDEFDRFRVEGRGPLPGVNVAYFEMLELGGKDDMLESVVAYIERDLADKLPSDGPILAVCAKGDTSEYVAKALRRCGYAGANLKGGMRAWARHYATHTVIEEADLGVYQVSRPARGCLSYIVASEGEAIVIDAARHLRPYLDFTGARNLTIKGVIDTHAHADHISGGPALAAATGAAYHLHPYDAIHPMDLLPATIAYSSVRDGQALTVGRHQLEAIHIPGHTLGLIALRLGDRYLFSGDSIFVRSIARPDLGGKANAWAPLHARSLRRLLTLPSGIGVLPGHFSTLAEADESGLVGASLDDLKRRNDGLGVLQRESEDGFVRYLLDSLPEFLPECVDIKRINAGLLEVSDEDAATLETGKNVCALSQAYAPSNGGVS
jgi:glyoxylase-like metal-dependent hydrolase (beta-lactamase superfamily II)